MSTHHDWALESELSALLPLDDAELKQIIDYTNNLPATEAASHLEGLLGDSPEALRFITSYTQHRQDMSAGDGKMAAEAHPPAYAPPPGPPPSQSSYAPPAGPPPGHSHGNGDVKRPLPDATSHAPPANNAPPSYAPPPNPPPANGASRARARNHTNPIIEAGKVRAQDEQEMQQLLQNLQFKYGIYNSDIEPEHETDYPCSCDIHQYNRRKWQRYGVQNMWSKAVLYPGEKAYTDNKNPYGTGFNTGIFGGNPYQFKVISPYGYNQSFGWDGSNQLGGGLQRPRATYYTQSIHQTIALNNSLNREAQASVDAREPKVNIWDDNPLQAAMEKLQLGDKKRGSVSEKRPNSSPDTTIAPQKSSKLSGFRKSLGIKSSEERQISKVEKDADKGLALKDLILDEESGRWPDEQWRWLVTVYQNKVGMENFIADLRNRKPLQYLHLLRAGYFEPIPRAWADQASNPLKFSIEAAAGWRGVTPAWRGYEDTAEERLYWVLNHREGSVGQRMKPDFISEMNMARERMAKAVPPPPDYYSPNDVCHVQHTSEGYSKQVLPSPFRPFDRPETPTDDTMILLDVSGSMDFNPVRPVYDQYLVTSYARSTQPKNKDVAKAIIRRFTDAMANHDHQFKGYDLTTFANHAAYIGSVNHQNLDQMWSRVRIGGGTRVMTGWQKVKELHFEKHSESATHHPVYGWQAGPETPMLRLLLLLDGEATDMDEFELDLLGLSWAHVTIFLIGVDGCPHHHRHANELQRISDVNHHVSFVDAQGNTPERYVTHELLKRHLGYDISMQEFTQMEELPAYSET